MKRKNFVAIWFCALLLAMSTLWISEAIAAQAEQPSGISMAVGRTKASTSFREVMINNPDIRILVEKSIKQASIINPDRKTNPVQSLNELYGFLDYTVTCMPWNIMPEERYGNFSTKCDQSILYVYWLLDQPLEELKDKELFYPSVEYLEPIYTWLTEYNNTWRDFLDSEASWKQEYLDMLLRDPSWNLDKGWYESPDNWHSFNEFFSRKLSNGNARPIAEPNDDRVVVSPADSLPQGVWNIDESAIETSAPVKEESEEEKNYPKLSGKKPEIILDMAPEEALKEILPLINTDNPVAVDLESSNSTVFGLSVKHDQVYIWTDVSMIEKIIASLSEVVGHSRETAPVVYSAKKHFKALESGLPFDQVFDIEIAGYVLNQIEGADPSFEMLIEHGSSRPFPILEGYGDEKNDGKKVSRQQDLFALIDGASGKESVSEEDVLDFAYRILLARWVSYYQKALIRNQDIEKLIYEIEMPLVMVLDRMERRGVLVDVNVIDELHKEFDSKVKALEQEIYDLAGEEFTILSPKQLGKVLFEKLGLPSGKKLASGGYSTNSEELERLADKHPIINKILEYRQIQKLDSTFVMGLKKSISEKDGRVHTTFSQAMTNTGRLSSSDPNLQNIPIRTELGSLIRKTFVAKEGYVLIDADYSQIELRLLAAIAHDEEMISAFLEGRDIHTKTACGIFGVPPEMIDAGMRSAAKRVNFSIVYGVSDYGLSQDLGISVYEAHRYIEEYYRQFPTIKPCLEGFKKEGHEKGYVSTLFGRRRILKELTSANHNIRSFGERAAMNTPIQGTAADIIKLAMNRAAQALSEKNLDAHLILQVHDELIVEAREDIAEEAAKVLSEAMENVVSLDVPLVAEAQIGKTWAEAH